MKKKVTSKTDDDRNYWAYAMVNGKLSDIWFTKKEGVHSHGYFNKDAVFSKREQKIIDRDIEKNVFTYRKGTYYNRITKQKHVLDLRKIEKDRKKYEKELRVSLKKDKAYQAFLKQKKK